MRLSLPSQLSALLRLWCATISLAALASFGAAKPAAAVSLIRDADIEHSLDQLALPILRAAGLNPGNIRVLVVNDSSPNAFVINGRAVFIHSGLIQRLGSAAQLQAVIAHEAAHIANGHFTRRMANLRNSNTSVGFGLALALAVALASDNGAAAGGVAAAWPAHRNANSSPTPAPKNPQLISPRSAICLALAWIRQRLWKCWSCFAGKKRCLPRGKIRMCAPTL